MQPPKEPEVDVSQQAPSDSPQLDSALERALLEGVGIGITVQDAAGRLIYANQLAAQIVGFPSPEALCAASESEVVARFEVFHADGRPLPAEELPSRLALGGRSTGEIMVRFRVRGEKRERWSFVRATPVRDRSGTVTHAISFFREVTSENRADEYRRFLLRATEELNSSLDYEKTLATIARFAVPLVADWCAVDLVDGERTKRVAVAHVDPTKLHFVEELERRYPPDPKTASGVPNILRTGRSELKSDLPHELIAAAAIDDEHLRLIEQLQLCSYIGVALTVRGRTIGAITFAMAESGRHYSEVDLEFAEALADRAALAIENARLFADISKARHSSEAIFGLMVASVKDYAIFMLDPKGLIATWNAGARLIKGYTAEEIIGQHFSRFYPDEDVRAGKCERELESAAREGRFEDEGWRVRKDGSRFWANVIITPVTDTAGELRGFAKVTRDLTERKRVEEELAAEQARRLSAERSAHFAQLFIGVLGHDLRNPLSAILTGTSYLSRIATSEKQSRTVARIESSGERMARMIDQLLDLTRIGIGEGIQLELRPAVLADIAQGVVDELGLAHGERTLRCDCFGDTAGTWDADRLAQAFSNLIGNAIQYGSDKDPVSLRIDGRGSMLMASLHNSGAIDAAMLPRLFEPFKGGARKRGSSSGLGLGLYISHEIIVAHGGELEVRSDEEHGTTFVITLPRHCTPAPRPPRGEVPA